MEEEYEVEDVEGIIPDGLEGSFYRNGPGEHVSAFSN